jgi:hypothetical protein
MQKHIATIALPLEMTRTLGSTAAVGLSAFKAKTGWEAAGTLAFLNSGEQTSGREGPFLDTWR